MGGKTVKKCVQSKKFVNDEDHYIGGNMKNPFRSPKETDTDDYQKDNETKAILPRACGVVVPVRIKETNQIVIFGSFHFKSGKDPKGRGARYYDCIAFLEAVEEVKTLLGKIEKVDNF